MESETMISAAAQGIGFEELAHYFHLPINQVSKELKICATVLKKICRRNGIPRWPHRKIKSLDRMIEALEATIPNSAEEQGRISKEIEEMKRKKLSILCNPSTEPGKKYKLTKSCKKMKKDSQRSQEEFPPDEAMMIPNSTTVASNPSHNCQEKYGSTPTDQEIAHTVSEIRTNLRARREKEEKNNQESSANKTQTSLVSSKSSGSNSPVLSNLPPQNISSTEATVCIMASNPVLPQPLQHRNIVRHGNEWSYLTIPPLINHQVNSFSKVPLPVMEPPVIIEPRPSIEPPPRPDMNPSWNWKF